MEETPWTFDRAKPVVMARQQHRCMRCGRYLWPGLWPGYACHHRMLRTLADPQWRHSPVNLVMLCGQDNSVGCHGWVHSHPRQAHELGYYLRQGDDPIEVPLTDWRGDQWLLTDDGTMHRIHTNPKGRLIP